MDIYKRLSTEYQSHKIGQNYRNKEEFKKLVWETLSPYFSNRDNFEVCFNLNQIVNEYNLFILNKEKPFFKLAFNSFFNIYQESKKENYKETFRTLSKELKNTTKAIQNYAEVGNLEQDKNIQRLDLFTKLCFRDIGEIIEGSIKQFSKQIFILSCNNTINKIEQTKEISFGTMVNILMKKGLENCYTLNPYNLTINQLRNIAFHTDYYICNEKNKIICKYGTNQVLELTRDELLDIASIINQLYISHKLSYELFMMDNVYEINSENLQLDVTEDSILITIYEIAYSYGFKVTESKLSSSIPYIKIVEFKRYDTNIFNNTKNIAIQFCQILRKGINLDVVPIFDIAPFTLKPRIP